MKYPITRFKNSKLALREIAQFVRSGQHLQTGKPLKRFGGLRPRELLANWLLCVAFNYDCRSAERLTFTSDPLDGDGLLYDTETEAVYPTEHVLVPDTQGQAVDVEALILKAIDDKRNKGGAAYAKGKTLVVFLNAGAARGSPMALLGDCFSRCTSRPCGLLVCTRSRRASMSMVRHYWT
jgi:hypothetical protein